MADAVRKDRLQRRDFLLLGTICLLFFGHALVIGRVLSMHESILPQTAREMFQDHDWMIPKNGGRPWLEKPPLPQWITVGVASLLGRCDAEWIVRIPPILMGTTCVLLVAWMSGLWFGRAVGWLSGLILATFWQFQRYATYAEADIFLCAIVTGAVALFVRATFAEKPDDRVRFFGWRSASTLGFFALLGLTNLVKGPLFGAVMVLVPVLGFLLLSRDGSGLRRYAWFWGGLIFLFLASFWPVQAYLRQPDVLELWRSDHVGRLSEGYIAEPTWYYALHLWWLLLPWTPLALAGMWSAARTAWTERRSPQRFLWCWALLPPLVFSLPDGKHHHYLLQCLAPWSVFAALGAVRVWQWLLAWPDHWRQPWLVTACWGAPALVLLAIFGKGLPGPDWLRPTLFLAAPLIIFTLCWAVFRRKGQHAMFGVFGVLMSLYIVGLTYKAHWLDRCRPDTEFLAHARPLAAPGQALFINVDHDSMESFRLQFYVGEQARVLHNLSFLRDDRIREEELLVIARQKFARQLAEYGTAQMLLQSPQTRREESPADRWTLFQVRLHPNLERGSATVPLTQLQITDRARGPYLGPLTTSGVKRVQGGLP